MNNACAPTATLSIAALSESLDKRGFVVVPSVLAARDVEQLRVRVDALMRSERPKSRQVLYVRGEVPPNTPHLDRLLHQWLNPHRFARNQGTADLLAGPRAIAARLLGADPVLFQDLILVKDSAQAAFPWHQDFPFWPIDVPRGLVCWTPLVPSTPEGGGLCFAQGSHRMGAQDAIDLHRGTAQDGHPTVDVGGFEIVCPALQPGDAVIFSPLVLHSSPRRALCGNRPAWSSVWLHPDCRWSHERAPAHPICRETIHGEKVHSHGVSL